MKLEGKTAIVTGAAAGIGESTVKLFASKGVNVVCNDITETGSKVVKDIQSVG